jgi:hypothetical protein
MGGTRTLLSVKLELEADTKGGSNTFDNESSTGGTVTVTIGVGLKMSGPSGLTTSVDAVDSATGFVTADSDPFSPNFTGSDSLSVSGSFVYEDAAPKTITTGLTPYLGPFDIPFSFEGIASTVGTSTGGLLGSNKVCVWRHRVWRFLQGDVHLRYDGPRAVDDRHGERWHTWARAVDPAKPSNLLRV